MMDTKMVTWLATAFTLAAIIIVVTSFLLLVKNGCKELDQQPECSPAARSFECSRGR